MKPRLRARAEFFAIAIFLAASPARAEIVRMQGLIDSPITRVAGAIVDGHRSNSFPYGNEGWNDLAKPAKFEWVKYMHIGMPLLMADRDFVVKLDLKYDADMKKIVATYESVTDPDVPLTAYIRGKIVKGQMTLEPRDDGKHTLFSYEGQVEWGGSVHKWAAYHIERFYVKQTIETLRRAVKRPNTTELASVMLLFEGKAQSLEELKF